MARWPVWVDALKIAGPSEGSRRMAAMPYSDPERQREYQREWKARRRAMFTDGVVCGECGGEPIDWHHRDPSTKIDHRIYSWSVPRIEAELANCVPLCRQCHNAIHNPRGPIPHGTHSGYSHHGCRCTECRAGTAAYERERRRRRKAGPGIEPGRHAA